MAGDRMLVVNGTSRFLIAEHAFAERLVGDALTFDDRSLLGGGGARAMDANDSRDTADG